MGRSGSFHSYIKDAAGAIAQLPGTTSPTEVATLSARRSLFPLPAGNSKAECVSTCNGEEQPGVAAPVPCITSPVAAAIDLACTSVLRTRSCSEDASTPVSSSEDASNAVSFHGGRLRKMFNPASLPPLPPLPPPGGCSSSLGEEEGGAVTTAVAAGGSCQSARSTSSSESDISTSSECSSSTVDKAVTATNNGAKAVAELTGCPPEASANSGTVASEQPQEPPEWSHRSGAMSHRSSQQEQQPEPPEWRAMIDSMRQAHKQATSARKVQAPVCCNCGADSAFHGRAAGCERCRDVLELHIWVEEEKQKVLALVAAGYKHWEDIPVNEPCNQAVDERESQLQHSPECMPSSSAGGGTSLVQSRLRQLTER